MLTELLVSLPGKTRKTFAEGRTPPEVFWIELEDKLLLELDDGRLLLLLEETLPAPGKELSVLLELTFMIGIEPSPPADRRNAAIAVAWAIIALLSNVYAIDYHSCKRSNMFIS